MTKAQAQQTGLVAGIKGTSGLCGQTGDGRLVGSSPADENDLDGKLFFSANTGKLVMISATAGVSTPEGIYLGSSTVAVKKAYPKWNGYKKGMNGLGYVMVSSSPKAFYRIYVDDGQVLELTLELADQDCAE